MKMIPQQAKGQQADVDALPGPGAALTPCAPHVTPISRCKGLVYQLEETAMDRGHQNGMTRRRFLQAGAVASFGLPGLPALLEAQDKKEERFGGFTLGVQ